MFLFLFHVQLWFHERTYGLGKRMAQTHGLICVNGRFVKKKKNEKIKENAINSFTF